MLATNPRGYGQLLVFQETARLANSRNCLIQSLDRRIPRFEKLCLRHSLVFEGSFLSKKLHSHYPIACRIRSFSLFETKKQIFKLVAYVLKPLFEIKRWSTSQISPHSSKKCHGEYCRKGAVTLLTGLAFQTSHDWRHALRCRGLCTEFFRGDRTTRVIYMPSKFETTANECDVTARNEPNHP